MKNQVFECIFISVKKDEKEILVSLSDCQDIHVILAKDMNEARMKAGMLLAHDEISIDDVEMIIRPFLNPLACDPMPFKSAPLNYGTLCATSIPSSSLTGSNSFSIIC